MKSLHCSCEEMPNAVICARPVVIAKLACHPKATRTSRAREGHMVLKGDERRATRRYSTPHVHRNEMASSGMMRRSRSSVHGRSSDKVPSLSVGYPRSQGRFDPALPGPGLSGAVRTRVRPRREILLRDFLVLGRDVEDDVRVIAIGLPHRPLLPRALGCAQAPSGAPDGGVTLARSRGDVGAQLHEPEAPVTRHRATAFTPEGTLCGTSGAHLGRGTTSRKPPINTTPHSLPLPLCGHCLARSKSPGNQLEVQNLLEFEAQFQKKTK